MKKPNKENTFSFEERKEKVKTDMKYNDKNNRLPICMLVGICLGASVGLVVGEICGNVPIGLFGIPIGSGLGIVFDSIRKKK